MVIRLYDDYCLGILKEACKINKEIINILLAKTQPGVTTLELELEAENLIHKYRCEPLFKGFENYPFCTCLSVNEYIVHGLANNIELKDGDVISIDIGLKYRQLCSDMARTKIVGDSKKHNKIIEVAERAFNKALNYCYEGFTTGDIGASILMSLPEDYKIFEKFEGHGIGLELHEGPAIPNYGIYGRGIELKNKMCICIEPVILYKKSNVIEYLDKDYNILQFRTDNYMPSAHFENQIYISENGPINLTE